MEQISMLMWLCLTAIASMLVGMLLGAYVYSFVKNTKPDWSKVIPFTVAILCPCGWLIYTGIQNNEGNIITVFVFLTMAAIGVYYGLNNGLGEPDDPGEEEDSEWT